MRGSNRSTHWKVLAVVASVSLAILLSVVTAFAQEGTLPVPRLFSASAYRAQTAFAVYSDEDKSLTFYKRDDVPAAGSAYNGKVATAVYSDFEASPGGIVPWQERAATVTSVNIADSGIAPASLTAWFNGFSQLTSITGLDKLNTSGVTNMDNMFDGCSSLREITGVGNWDTSQVASMTSTFSGCSALTLISGIGNWNTAKLDVAASTFGNCLSLTTLDLSGWSTNAMRASARMFDGCANLATVYIGSNWNAASINDSGSMFHGCAHLPNYSSSAVDRSKAHARPSGYLTCSGKMEGGSHNTVGGHCTVCGEPAPNAEGTAFAVYSADDSSLCFYKRDYLPTEATLFRDKVATKVYTGFESLDTSVNSVPWNGDKNIVRVEIVDGGIQPISLAHWFEDLSNASSFSGLEKLDTSRVTSLWGTFWGCESIVSLSGLNTWDTSKVTSMLGTFSGCKSLQSLDLTGWSPISVEETTVMFSGCSSLRAVSGLASWDVSNVTVMGSMFNGCSSLQSLSDIAQWNTGKVENLSGLFASCGSLVSLDLSGWNMASAKAVAGMFLGCTSLRTVNASGWNTENVSSAGDMFYNCGALASIEGIESWNTGALTETSNMFSGCSALTSLDLSGWDTSAVTHMHHMFNGCSNLASIYVGLGWSTASVTDEVPWGSTEMFLGCSKLPGFVDAATNKAAAHVGSGGYLTWVGFKEGGAHGYTVSDFTDAANVAFKYYECGCCGYHYWENVATHETGLEKELVGWAEHAYGAAVYEWQGTGAAESAYVCIAKRKCTAAGHVDELTASATISRTAYTAPSCTEDGSATFMAKFAESWADTKYKVETLPALGHDLVSHEGVAPTCTTAGWADYSTCTRCDYTTRVDIPALGHDFGTASFAWTGTIAAKATFDCSRCDATEEKTAIVTSTVKAPATCTAKGTTTYTAKATSSTGKVASESCDRTDIAALGHAYGTAVFAWAENGKTATASFTCSRCNDVQNKTATVTSAVKTAATCTAKGTTTYTAKVTFNGAEYSATKDVVDIAALGHDYSAASFAFAADGKSATATFTCANGCGVNEQKTATITSAVKIPATCTVKGTTTYTATATSSTGTQKSSTKDVVDIAALGHDFNSGSISFAADGKSATATFDCSRCDATEQKTASITSKVKTAATCTAKGTTTYTASATSSTNKVVSAIKDVTDIAALSHDYSEPTFNWSDDGKSATVTFGCSRCDSAESKSAGVTSKVKTDPTCTVKGTTTYTAAATSSTGKAASETKDVTDIAALGHAYGEAVWAWTGTSSATAIFTCSRCNDVQTKNATITSAVKTAATCTAKGTTTYTATTTDMSGKTVTTTKDAQDIAALGHNYSTASFTWTGTSSATATFTCSRCSGTEEKAATITSKVTTTATCTVKGTTTYTASATSSTGTTKTDTKTAQDVAALGHAYGEAVFAWATDGKSATASFTCSRCNDVQNKTATVTSAVKTAATCTAKGTTTYTAKVTFNGTEYSATKDVVDINATGHNYNSATFDFAEDGKSATATFTCANGCGVKEEKAAAITSAVKTAATCTAKGATTYTATATSSTGTEKSATKDVTDIAALGHDYNAGSISFAADGKTATATFDCSRCDATESKAASVTSAVKTAATCTVKGTTTYTASATSSTNKVVSATKDVTDIVALGHSYSEPAFNWSDDGKSATVAFGCSRCDATEQKDAAVTSKVKTPPTCTAKGTTTYTATATSSTNVTKTATKDVADIAALGHSYGEAAWTWTGTISAKAAFTCATCNDTQTKDAAVTSKVKADATCEAKGWTTYTAATTDMSGKAVTTTRDAQDIAMLGHDFGTGAIVFAADGKSATATFGCSRCDATESKAAAVASAVKTAATCTAEGATTYTAKATSSTGKAISATKDVQDIAALGHSFAPFTVDVEPTCTAAGSKSRHCSRCDAKDEVTEIPAKDHSWGAWQVTKPATTNEEGLRECKCVACNEKKSEPIPKLTSGGSTGGAGGGGGGGAPAPSPSEPENPVDPDEPTEPEAPEQPENPGDTNVPAEPKPPVTAVVDRVTYTVNTETGTASVTVSPKATSATIRSTVTVDGETYKVTTLTAAATEGCGKLKSLTVAKGITKISKGALANCPKLTSLSIGLDVTAVPSKALAKCSKLKTIKVYSGKLSKKQIINLLKGSNVTTVTLAGKAAKAKKASYATWVKSVSKAIKVRSF